MSRKKKRIITILLGFTITICSLLFLKYVSQNSLIPAVAFSAGFIMILESIKQASFDLAQKAKRNRSEPEK